MLREGNHKCGKIKGEFMMPKVLKLCFEPDDDDVEKCTDIVVDLGWIGCRRWKTEMTSKKAGKRTYEHVTAAGGVRSDRAMAMEEKKASKKMTRTNDKAESPFFYGEGNKTSLWA